MAKFKFQMSNILSLKENIATQKEQEFGKAMQALALEKQKLEKLELDKSNSIARLRGEMGIKIKPTEFQQIQQYIEFLKIKIEEQKNIIKTAQKFVEFKRHELIEATKEKKMLEKLKEKKYEEYIEEEKVSEQKTVDEIVSYKYAPDKKEKVS